MCEDIHKYIKEREDWGKNIKYSNIRANWGQKQVNDDWNRVGKKLLPENQQYKLQSDYI